MTYCNTLNVKLFGSQLNKLKSRIKNDTEVTLNLSSDVVGGFIDETNLSFHINFYQLKLKCRGFLKLSKLTVEDDTVRRKIY